MASQSVCWASDSLCRHTLIANESYSALVHGKTLAELLVILHFPLNDDVYFVSSSVSVL